LLHFSPFRFPLIPVGFGQFPKRNWPRIWPRRVPAEGAAPLLLRGRATSPPQPPADAVQPFAPGAAFEPARRGIAAP